MTATRGPIMGRRLPGLAEREALAGRLVEAEEHLREVSQNPHLTRAERGRVALLAEQTNAEVVRLGAGQ